MDERMYFAAWSRLPRIGSRRVFALRDHFGSLEPAWKASARALERVPLWGEEIAEEVAIARAALDPAAWWEQLTQFPMQVLTWLDAEYPAPFRDLSDPPPVIYVMGKLPKWERAIGIVGTRGPTPYGERAARKLGKDLAQAGCVIVSGVAAGIDRAAHEGALDAKETPGVVTTVGVLGCGFKHVFPAANKRLYRAIADEGALLTEYPPDVLPLKGNFPYRNRLIAALSRGVVVVEARPGSGSLITANLALEQGREVFAVPGPIEHPTAVGPHELLRQGACLVAGAEDVLAEFGWDRDVVPRSSEDPLERRILELLTEGPRHVDELAIQAGLSIGQAGSVLLVMQLKGLVQQRAGNLFEKE